MGFTVMSVLSVCEFGMIFVIKYFVDQDRKASAVVESGVGRIGSDDDSQVVAQEK
jgi:ACS family pantothenate transporter-like MFS transporter